MSRVTSHDPESASLFGRRLPRRWLVAGFFVLLTLGGVLGYRHYGVSWDEINMVEMGNQVYDSLTKGLPWPEEKSKRYYGPVFELVLTSAQRITGADDGRSILLLRHLLSFLAFVAGVYAFYRLVLERTGRWGYALLGAAMLALSPRIFADAFYNSKDIPAMSAFILSMWTLLRFFKEPTWKRLILHAAASALLLSIRIPGVLVPVATSFLLAVHAAIAIARDRSSVGAIAKEATLRIGAYLLLTVILTIVLWPFLWQDPVSRFLEAYRFGTTLGFGGFYFGTQLEEAFPWHYPFVWIFITTPLVYTALFLTGLGLTVKRAIRHPIRWLEESPHDAAVLLWFFGPIAAVILAGGGIFDGWRHLYFIYPAFLLLAILGWQGITTFYHARGRMLVWKTCAWILGVWMAWLAVWMVVNHPLQNVYFSLPSSMIQNRFELDYWGLSYRPALEWVLENDPAPIIPIHVLNSPGLYTYNILTPQQQARIQYVGSPAEAKYFLNNYRTQYGQPVPYPKVHAITVGGIEVLGIYQPRQ